MASGMLPIAIRWDSWYSAAGSNPQGWNTIGATRWQSRAPWFSQVISPFAISSVGTQANMDMEIQLASQAGIKCFMFDWYQWAGASDAPLFTGYNLYSTSAYNSLVKWCGAPVPVDFVGTGAYQARCNAWVAYFLQSNYQKVLSNRPLLFIFDTTSQVNTFFGGYANFKVAMDYLRSQTVAAGLGTPYICLLGSGGIAATTAANVVSAGADCIAQYAPPVIPRIASPFSNLDSDAKTFWAAQLATGANFIPPAITGWDVRPRYEHPESYTHGLVKPWMGDNVYFVKPSVSVAATHISDAINYAFTNVATNPTKSVLIYSWCECTEGGNGMIPTLGDPPVNVESGQPLLTSNLLKAVGTVLRAVA